MNRNLFFTFILSAFIISCNSSGDGDNTGDSITPAPDNTGILEENDTSEKKAYSNTRFREVTVDKLNDTTFRIRGEAQIFEASFGWVVEDGHNELKTGFSTADKGAPEWGKFDFTVNARKERENSTLHLVLFETSMKDGSRQHELMVPLVTSKEKGLSEEDALLLKEGFRR